MERNILRRIAFLIAVLFVVGFVPTNVFAEVAEGIGKAYIKYVYKDNNGKRIEIEESREDKYGKEITGKIGGSLFDHIYEKTFKAPEFVGYKYANLVEVPGQHNRFAEIPNATLTLIYTKEDEIIKKDGTRQIPKGYVDLKFKASEGSTLDDNKNEKDEVVYSVNPKANVVVDSMGADFSVMGKDFEGKNITASVPKVKAKEGYEVINHKPSEHETTSWGYDNYEKLGRKIEQETIFNSKVKNLNPPKDEEPEKNVPGVDDDKNESEGPKEDDKEVPSVPKKPEAPVEPQVPELPKNPSEDDSKTDLPKVPKEPEPKLPDNNKSKDESLPLPNVPEYNPQKENNNQFLSGYRQDYVTKNVESKKENKIEDKNEKIKSIIKQDAVIKKSYIKGNDSGEFMPTKSITRAEIVEIIARILEEKNTEFNTILSNYNDVDSKAWYYNALQKVSAAGIVKGNKNNSFLPLREMTKAEFVTIISRLKKLQKQNGNSLGINKNHWAMKDIEAALQAGFLEIYTTGKVSFNADDKITREEVVAIINKAFNIIPDKKAIDENESKLNKFSDLDKNSWSYYDIVAAANLE